MYFIDIMKLKLVFLHLNEFFIKNVVNFPCKFSFHVDCVHVLRIMYVQY